ncbi:MAG: GSCFA domain-containing protein [Algicola sp.]|nr:GSCFA domain-containing protein [Algicola sp.]
MQFSKIKFPDEPELNVLSVQYENEQYHLVPDHHHGLRALIEKKQRFGELNTVAEQQFDRHYVVKPCELSQKHLTRQKMVLPADLCAQLISQNEQNPDAIKHPKVIDSLLPLILSEDIDSQICSYFGSEYTLMWYSYLQTSPDRENRSYSSYWHCDMGPEKHLKMLIYLNDYDSHLGNTKFLTKQSTDQLKKAGYIFGAVGNRTDDIGPLCRDRDIDMTETLFEDIHAGDALLFNPNQLAHIGKIPELDDRHVLQLCFVPSPYHWQFSQQSVLPVQTFCSPFDGVADKILDYVASQSVELEDQLLIPSGGGIDSSQQLNWLLHNIFPEGDYAQAIYKRLIQADPHRVQVHSVESLICYLKDAALNTINWEGELGLEHVRNLAQLTQYEKSFQHSKTRYTAEGKNNPSAIYWPMPDHPNYPMSKFDALPFVNKHPIMDISTPIGSAGSCFAFEIARIFQESGYNYVVTERNDDPQSGVVIAGYNPGDTNAKFSANYGILFNTPSFKQLAERAFDVKPTKRSLFQLPEGGWVDPYREGVMFYNTESYEEDYPRHIAATRTALEQVEVFIITLGLNECWEFRDGSAMSRNPRGNMYPYVKHKTLTVAENVANIQAFYDIVKQHNSNFKLIISVSPIPFLATGRAKEKHVIAANTHSKSVLRITAEQLVANNEDVYYLPSYELVMECIEDAWEIDTRHVKKTTVEQVVAMFKQIFIK